MRLSCCSLLLGLVGLALPVAAQEPPPAPTPADAAAPATAGEPDTPVVPRALALEGPVAMVFHTIKADKVIEFEQLFTRLRDGLTASSNDVRRRQAAGWRLLKQVAPTAEGHIIYVAVIDPVVVGEEYDMARLLDEVYPDEGTALYQSLLAAHVQPTVQAASLTAVTTPEAQP